MNGLAFSPATVTRGTPRPVPRRLSSHRGRALYERLGFVVVEETDTHFRMRFTA